MKKINRFKCQSVALSMILATGLCYVAQVKADVSDCIPWERQYDELFLVGKEDRVITVRHRGDFTTTVPENSLAAFRLSYDKCRAAIETDVRILNDGSLVVFHDVNIGKMLVPGYNAIDNTPSNPLLKTMSLEELQKLKLVNIAGKVTDQSVPTVKEMLEDYLKYGGRSLIYLEVKDPAAILKTAKVVTDLSKKDNSILKRVIIKFNMAEFPTPNLWIAGLQSVGADERIMANPVISPGAMKKIDQLPRIPEIPNRGFSDNTSRAVAWWALSDIQRCPTIEVVIKDSSGFDKVMLKTSKQGGYYAPTEVSIGNTYSGITTTMARLVAIVKEYKKPLGVFVPVPDYILWSNGVIMGTTVPSLFTKKQFDINAAFYHNTSECCYALTDRFAPSETDDYRENVAWQQSLKVNIITADDTDSIDTYFEEEGLLDTFAIPHPTKPSPKMHSKLSWDLGFVEKPKEQFVRIKVWKGENASEDKWGKGYPICLWDNPHSDSYAWIYTCETDAANKAIEAGYSRDLVTRVVQNDTWSKEYGDLIQITSPRIEIVDGKEKNVLWCLNGRLDYEKKSMSWVKECDPANKNTLFIRTDSVSYGSIASSTMHEVPIYLAGATFGWKEYNGLLYSRVTASYLGDVGKWGEWKIDPSPVDEVEE